jgi:hypothetical protein
MKQDDSQDRFIVGMWAITFAIFLVLHWFGVRMAFTFSGV